jgi:hypothetical protein
LIFCRSSKELNFCKPPLITLIWSGFSECINSLIYTVSYHEGIRMKSTLQSLLAVLFIAALLGACSKKEDEAAAPADAATAAAPMPAPAPEPVKQEPGGWVPPPADAVPPAPAAEAAPAPAPDAAPVPEKAQ